MHQEKSYQCSLLSREHSHAFYQLIQNNRSRLEDFFAGTVRKTNTVEATQQFCKEVEEQIKAKYYFPYVIIAKESGQLVGFIDVKNIDWSIPKAELGAFIDEAAEGNGIVFHFVDQLIQDLVATHHFKKIMCRVAPENTRSIRVVERLGFCLEGTIRSDYRTTSGRLVDLNYYGRIF